MHLNEGIFLNIPQGQPLTGRFDEGSPRLTISIERYRQWTR
jgi:hypothetical protein